MSGEVRLCRTEKRQVDGREEISTGRPLPNTAAVNLEVRPSRESLGHPPNTIDSSTCSALLPRLAFVLRCSESLRICGMQSLIPRGDKADVEATSIFT